MTGKRAIAFLLTAAVLAGCLAGCGSNAASSRADETERPSRTSAAETQAPTNKAETTSAAASETAAPETTAAPKPYSSDNAEVRALLAEAKHLLFDLGDVEHAEPLLLKAAEAGSPLAMYYMSNVVINKDLVGEELQKQYDQWQNLAMNAAFPLAEAGDPEGCLTMGFLLQFSEKYRDRAIAYFETAAAAGLTDAMIGLGDVWDRASNSDKAEEWYRKAYDAGDKAGGRKLAPVYLLSQKYRQALELYEEMMDDDYRPWYSIGRCYLLLKEYDGAANAYQKGIDEGQEACSFGLGTVWFVKGESRKALECFAAYMKNKKEGTVDLNEQDIRNYIRFMLNKQTTTPAEVDEIMGEGFAASLSAN